MSIITVETYNPSWPTEFKTTAACIRQAVGDIALRIDHIGSTSVPGLDAKPVIDLQITVASLSDAFSKPQSLINPMVALGFIHRPDAPHDRAPPWAAQTPELWRKNYFRTPTPTLPQATAANLRTHAHVRELGKPNQRYALLFRDYLRCHPEPAAAYALYKHTAAAIVGEQSGPGGAGPYLDLKNPVLDLIAHGAQIWAESTHWSPGPTDC